MAQMNPDDSAIAPQFEDAATPMPPEPVVAPEAAPAGEVEVPTGDLVEEATPITEALAQPPDISPLNDIVADKDISVHQNLLAKQTDARLEAARRGKLKVAGIDEQLGAIKQHKAELSQWELVHAMEAHQAEQQGHVKEMMAELKTQNLRYRQAIDDFKNLNPNPWANRSTGFMLGSALASALGGIGSAMSGSGQNTAMNLLNATLSQDLEIQRMEFNQAEANIKHEAGMYAQMREIYADEDSAMSAAWAGSKELLAERAKAIMMTLSPQERTLQAQKIVAQIDADAMEDKSKADQKAFDNHFKVYQVKSRETAANAAMALRQQIAMGKGQISPNIFAAEGLKGKQLDDSVQFMADYTGSFREAVDFVNRYWAAPLSQQTDVAAYNMLKSKLAVISQNLKTINRQGMRFSNKLQEIDELISSGASHGEIVKILTNFVTDGAMRDDFAMASEAMDRDFRKKIEFTSGHSPEYWVDKQHAKLQQDVDMLRMMNMPSGGEAPTE